MANARTRYDTIAEFMTREHDATSTTQYGKPAVQINGTAFLFYMLPGMAFRLQGRAREGARSGQGAPSSAHVDVADTCFVTPTRTELNAAHG